MDEGRTNHFLRMIRRSTRGRLKIYLGYCAGVGKTYRMLQEGQILKSEGIDVVAAYVETHGRADVEKLLEGFKTIPRIRRDYHGIVLEEMDTDAVLERKPAVALIDELAHTNVPGGRNLKRYQDVQEILAAGIHVITTLNVQHLESLYNTVEGFTGVKVRERLPDTVVSEADQIINVDLSTEDLRKRLEEGKIYPTDRIQAALANFFVAANLERLRELTLRELAAQIDLRRHEPVTEDGMAMPDQVMVCLSSRGPNSDLLLRYASRFAGRLNKNWYALYVQRDVEDPVHIDLQTQISLANTLTLAKQLGAIVFTYKGEDLASTILRFAREYRIGHIIIGTPARLSRLDRLLFRKSLSERLIQEAKNINVVVVNTEHGIPIPGAATDKPAARAQIDKWNLTGYIRQENVIIWKDMALKEEVLRKLAGTANVPGQDAGKITASLMLREKESSTFFNEGVAFPHLRLAGDFPPQLALGIIPNGVADLTTIAPVRLVFLVLSPAERPEAQARILAAFSRIAGNDRMVAELLSARTPRQVLHAIGEWEARYCSPEA